MSFYEDVIRKDPRFNSPQRITDLDLLEPITRAAIVEIVAQCAAMGLPVIVFETYRSQIRQEALFKAGATQLSKVGVHGMGLACDLVRVVNGQPTWDVNYKFMGPLAKAVGLVWGGSWPGFKDMDHMQRCLVVNQNALFSGNYYPPDYEFSVGAV
jgi:hypothetical protein